MARRSLSPRAGCADAGILFRRRTGRETRVIHVAWPNLLVSAIRGGWSTRRNAREEGRGKRDEVDGRREEGRGRREEGGGRREEGGGKRGAGGAEQDPITVE
jgi:hypothetical protein